MQYEAICVSVTRVELPQSHGDSRVVYRTEFEGADGGSLRLILPEPKFRPGERIQASIQ